MKKFMVLLMVLIGFSSYGQQHESLSAFWGTTNKLGFELNVVSHSNITYGFGLTYDLARKNKGVEVLKDQYDRDPAVYDISSSELFNVGSLYGTMGYFVDNTIIGVKLGFGAKKHYTYFNNNPNGDYVTRDGGTYLLYGLYVTRPITRFISPYLGVDNFNGLNFGITYTFN